MTSNINALSSITDQVQSHQRGRKMGKLRVAIVGAGPTGLMAAILLHSKGVNVTLYDQSEIRLKLPKAHIVNSRAGELFREIGIMDEMERLSAPPEQCQYVTWSESIPGVTSGGHD